MTPNRREFDLEGSTPLTAVFGRGSGSDSPTCPLIVNNGLPGHIAVTSTSAPTADVQATLLSEINRDTEAEVQEGWAEMLRKAENKRGSGHVCRINRPDT